MRLSVAVFELNRAIWKDSFAFSWFFPTGYKLYCIYVVLEIKPCGLGSRIWDTEAEWRLKFLTDLISWWIFGEQNWRWGMNRTLSKVCAKIWCFWPLIAFTTSEVKNDHIHVITQDICNKFIEIKNFVGYMVWVWCWIWQHPKHT